MKTLDISNELNGKKGKNVKDYNQTMIYYYMVCNVVSLLKQ